MCSLPDSLLQPLLQRLHLEKVQRQNGQQITAKQFLFNCDPALRSVVAKEALQWRKGNVTQVRKIHMSLYTLYYKILYIKLYKKYNICVHDYNINVNVLRLEYFYNMFIGRSYLETQRKNALPKFNQSYYKCYTKVTVSREAVAMCFI